ncbi:purple acid phosphatase [Anaeramoeba flamelloides]|uniref:Purple acid phosphatase n=1 Tax=Anaeramoeba flamelloides TaxID=1746091 RepID=A0AAV7ZXX5_9EUKA|nr:purple acid phosphatase [Anaeramoeba flamelloides]
MVVSPRVKYSTKKPKSFKDYEFTAVGTSFKMKKIEIDRYISFVLLDNLQLDNTYYFIAGDADSEEDKWTDVRKFRSGPKNDQELRFLNGGDPNWFENWESSAITKKGYTVPILPIIGNHETAGQYIFRNKTDPEKAPFFFNFFRSTPILSDPFNQKSYDWFKITKDFAIIRLDSGHIYDIWGQQKLWLLRTLNELKSRKFKTIFIGYHVPMYPGNEPFEVEKSARLRDAWLDLIDEYKIPIVFEYHSHIMKRTKPLRANEFGYKGEGTVYIGDGSMGRVRSDTRDPNQLRWYEEKISPENHGWIVKVKGRQYSFLAYNKVGNIIDSFSRGKK